ncbi:MAG: hypothetical protein LBT14_00255 [Treponema sp.]|jgi:hypothetical protein|nr:hypothetical protein [Treponema sp.]
MEGKNLVELVKQQAELIGQLRARIVSIHAFTHYNEYKKVNYYSWVTAVEKKDVQIENGLFTIEIKNKTYPHSGYAYLDLTTLEIVVLN